MSAYSVTEPFLQFVDRDGQPLEDGYVFIGAGGANPEANPITVYLDAALTTPLAQPIRTTNGYPTNNATPVALYVDASDYSVTLKDKRGALVVTKLSNVTMIPFDNTTGNISATRVVFQQTGSSVTRTLDSRLKESCSVFDFMTAAQIADVQARTFLFDVTAPIQAAINSGARDIYFPAGSYKVTSSAAGPGTPAIQLPSGLPMRLHGAGSGDVGALLSSTIIKDFGDWRTISIGGGFYSTDVVISDIALQASAPTKELIYVNNTAKTILERLWLQSAGFDGIRILNSIGATIRDVKTVGAPTANAIILAENTIGCTVDSCYISDYAVGLRFTDNGGTRPRGHTVIGCTFSGSATYSLFLENTDDCRVYGCTFLPGDPTNHIRVDGPASPSAGNLIHGCKLETAGGGSPMVALYIDRADGTTIDSCKIDATGAAGSWTVTANATATNFINTTELGTESNASTGTTRYMEGLYSVRRANTYTGPTRFGMGSATSEGVVEFAGFSDAMKWRKVQVSNLALPGATDLAILQLRAFDSGGTFTGDARVWAVAGNAVIRSSDPTTVVDGLPIGPGCATFLCANLPVSPPIGTMARVTDIGGFVPPIAWGNIVNAGSGGGANVRFVIWNGTNWTVIGV